LCFGVGSGPETFEDEVEDLGWSRNKQTDILWINLEVLNMGSCLLYWEVNYLTCVYFKCLHQCFSTFLRSRSPKWHPKTLQNLNCPQKNFAEPQLF
jgi:hypothetical protein